MSTSDIYILNQKSTRHMAEFSNGWGSAPMAWDHLAKKYFPGEDICVINPTSMKKVWRLADDTRLERHEKVALMMTFDRSYIPLENLVEAGIACNLFGEECEDGARVNHWPAFGEELLELSDMSFSKHARGVCLSCTSVCDNWIEPTADWLENPWPIFGADEIQ